MTLQISEFAISVDELSRGCYYDFFNNSHSLLQMVSVQNTYWYSEIFGKHCHDWLYNIYY